MEEKNDERDIDLISFESETFSHQRKLVYESLSNVGCYLYDRKFVIPKIIFGYFTIFLYFLVFSVPAYGLTGLIKGLKGFSTLLTNILESMTNITTTVPLYFKRRRMRKRLKEHCEMQEYLIKANLLKLDMLWNINANGDNESDKELVCSEVCRLSKLFATNPEMVKVLGKYTNSEDVNLYETLLPFVDDLWLCEYNPEYYNKLKSLKEDPKLVSEKYNEKEE